MSWHWSERRRSQALISYEAFIAANTGQWYPPAISTPAASTAVNIGMNITTCSFICYLPSTLIKWLSESIGLVKKGMIRVVMYSIYDLVKEHPSVILKLTLILLKLIYGLLKLYVNSLSRTKTYYELYGTHRLAEIFNSIFSFWTNSIIFLFSKFCILIPLLYRCYGYLNWMVKFNGKV